MLHTLSVCYYSSLVRALLLGKLNDFRHGLYERVSITTGRPLDIFGGRWEQITQRTYFVASGIALGSHQKKALMLVVDFRNHYLAASFEHTENPINHSLRASSSFHPMSLIAKSSRLFGCLLLGMYS